MQSPTIRSLYDTSELLRPELIGSCTTALPQSCALTSSHTSDSSQSCLSDYNALWIELIDAKQPKLWLSSCSSLGLVKVKLSYKLPAITVKSHNRQPIYQHAPRHEVQRASKNCEFRMQKIIISLSIVSETCNCCLPHGCFHRISEHLYYQVYPSLGSLLFLTKLELFSEWLNYQQALTQNRQGRAITTCSFIGVRQGLQSDLQPYQRLDKVICTLPKISPILLLHSALALVSRTSLV